MPALGNKGYINDGEGIDLRAAVDKLKGFEKTYVLDSYANELNEDAVNARRRGWYEQANFLAELAHQMTCGYVVMPGEFIGLESALEDERRNLEETLNTGLKPSGVLN